MNDPLESVTVPAPPGSAIDGEDTSPMSVNVRRMVARQLVALAREFVPSDVLAASPYRTMTTATLLQQAGFVGEYRNPRDPHGNAYQFGTLVNLIEITDLPVVMVFLDALARDAGRPTAFVAPIDLAPPPRKRSKVPHAPAGTYRVVKGGVVAIPGGLTTMHAGAILEHGSYGDAVLESVIDQGIVIEPHPLPPEAAERHECAVCGSTWRGHLGEHCPMCFLMHGLAAAPDHPCIPSPLEALERERTHTQELVAELGHMERLAHGLRSSLAAVTAWAVEMGAPEPGVDGLWNGEQRPGPLAVVTEEAARVRSHQALVAGGLSDAEARGAIWPEELAPPPEDTALAPAPSFDTSDIEAPKASGKAGRGATKGGKG